MTDIYDGIARDLSDGAVQRIDENPVVREFFELPTHESAARILAEEWRDSVIFESFGKGFADRKAGRFYRRTAGGWYEPFADIINAASDLLAQKIADFAHPLILEAKKEILENLKAALRRARSRDFIESALVYLSAIVEVPDLSRKWNQATETLPILDGIADFTGQELIIRHAKPGEYYKNPLPITAQELMAEGEPAAFLRFIGDLFPDPDTSRSALELLSLAVTNIGQRIFAIWKGRCSNGKSLLGEVMRQLLGDFGGMLSGTALIRGDAGGKRFAASDLAGKRFVMAEEVSRPLDVEEVKRLTGGQPVKVEQKGLPEVVVPANWLLCISTNNLPKFEEAEKDPSGFLDRLFVLPFKMQFYANEDHKKRLIEQGSREEYLRPQRDAHEIVDEILRERGAVVRLLIDTWLRVRQNNRGRPYQSAECRATYNAYRIANDSIAEFIEQNFLYVPAARVEYSTIVEKWLEHFGEKNAPTTQKIIKTVIEHYDRYNIEVKPIKGTHGRRFLENIAVRDYDNDPPKETNEPNNTQEERDYIDNNISIYPSSSTLKGGEGGENGKNPIGYRKKNFPGSDWKSAKFATFATTTEPGDPLPEISTEHLALVSGVLAELFSAARGAQGEGGNLLEEERKITIPIGWWRDACAAKGMDQKTIAAAENYIQGLGMTDGKFVFEEVQK
jgi:phage/plasmid-associated DNA primase